ncbi:PDZ domain-containing protein [Pseudomarimonas arenosa]|uniref:PDZ domain-containing protein n=1 Tax=Pseudomarimonas arenosa TaxID=2774145 RepID=A0AAW3ZSC9_9GAMM|nr:PDZ domain-containing protein [Pseudomarimonas arenosa]MBD8527957.1 hypothetical protein [Pseudomarimonas arenosa]
MKTCLANTSLALSLAALLGACPSVAGEALNSLDQAVLDMTSGGALLEVVEQPPRTVWELGAVVGAPESESAPRIMAVTPGAAAQRMGLRTGDRLLAVNEQPLPAGSEGASLLRQALSSAEGQIAFEVQRDNQIVPLEGPLDRTDVPGYRLEIATTAASSGGGAGDGSSCARVSTFDVSPRTQELHRAVLIAIDGELPGPLSAATFRITPGKHVLKVAEAIDGYEFTPVQLRQRNRQMLDVRYKELELVAEPGITYRLAAKLHRDQRHQIYSGNYWEPVIWKESPEPCR